MISVLKSSYKELESVGMATDLGAVVQSQSDDARVYSKEICNAGSLSASFALFRSEKGRYVVEYPFSEHAIVVEGSVTITKLSSSESQTYHVGEGWAFDKGTKVRFEIGEGGFTKAYWSF